MSVQEELHKAVSKLSEDEAKGYLEEIGVSVGRAAADPSEVMDIVGDVVRRIINKNESD